MLNVINYCLFTNNLIQSTIFRFENYNHLFPQCLILNYQSSDLTFQIYFDWVCCSFQILCFEKYCILCSDACQLVHPLTYYITIDTSQFILGKVYCKGDYLHNKSVLLLLGQQYLWSSNEYFHFFYPKYSPYTGDTDFEYQSTILYMYQRQHWCYQSKLQLHLLKIFSN